MNIQTDKLRFPLVKLNGSGFMHLWPVTKAQFERFMCESDRYDDSWYETACKHNPRISWRSFNEGTYEQLFMTGIYPPEALEFARWLGEGFDLPTIAEWREFYWLMKEDQITSQPAEGLSPTAQTIWQKVAGFAQRATQFAFMESGVLEWVRKNGSFVGLGSPRPSFHPNAWEPMTDKVKILRPDERLFYLGFRLIKRRVA